MGNACSCFQFQQAPVKENGLTEREPSWFPNRGMECFNNELGESTVGEVVVIDDGELTKIRQSLPHGAAANLCSLVCQTYDLALLALHSRNTSFYLVKRLISIQNSILSERLLLADGVLMLQAQELSLEVGQMIKLFSCRGWLARLNRLDVDDEVEFDRLVKGINLLSERCGLPVTIDTEDWESILPASSFLIDALKSQGGLHILIDKSEDALREFIDVLMEGLDVDGEVAMQAVAEEIRIAAASEMPAAHTVIRHADLRFIWWSYFDTEEVSWEDFWKVFPDSLTTLEDSSDAVGDLSVIRALLQSPAARRQFRTTVNYCRNSDYVLSIEIDSAFAPNRTIEESIAILLDPLEDSSPIHVQDRDSLLRESVKSTTQRMIRDEAGVPGEGTEITGRIKEISEIYTSIETGQCTVMITGAPGIGKTAVATTVADELLKHRIVKKAHFINLANVHELSEAISRIGVSLKLPIYQSAISSENRLKNWLKRHGNLHSPTCWVLDGLDQLLIMPDTRMEFFGLLMDILDFAPKLSFIMTCSEAPDPAEVSCIDQVVHLGPLNKTEAFKFAESLLGGALSAGEASDLVSASEGFPLGIKIGGNGILSGGCSASHFLSRLKQIRRDFAVPMRSGWNRCHDIIREGLMSLSVEDKQGLILLTQCPDNFTIDHAAAVLDRSQKPTQTWSLLWRLMMRGFLRYIPSNGSYRIEDSVFDLVSVCTEIRSSEDRRDPHEDVPGSLEIDEDLRDSARAGLVIHYLRLLDRALVIFRTGFHLSTYRLLEQESDGFDRFAQYLAEHSVRHKLLSMGHKGKLKKLMKILSDFLVDVGKHYFTWSQVKSICESITHLWEEDTPHNYDEVSYKLLLSLANALASIGERRDAEGILNQMESAIDAMNSCSDKDLKAKANLLVVRAKIQHLIGRYPEAERLFLQGLHAQQGAYGSEHFIVSRTHSLLATVQQLLQKFEDAERSYKASLKIRMKHSNKNVLEVPTVMHNWASLNQRLRRHADAETLYVKSLILREKYLGHKNVEVASTLVSLAAVKLSLQDFDEAQNLYSRALWMLKDIVGEDHLAVSHTSTRLGVLLETKRSYEEAVQLFADALKIVLRVFGDQHESVLKSVSRIQRVAVKQAQKLKSASQLETWKTYIEKLLTPFQYTWPDAWVSVNGGDSSRLQGLETTTDLFGTSHSISKSVIPGANVQQQEQLQQSLNSESLSFQGFVQTNNQYLRKQSGKDSLWESGSERIQNQAGMDSGEASSTPSTPQMLLVGRSRSALGPYFGDPPSPSSQRDQVSSVHHPAPSIRKCPSDGHSQGPRRMDHEPNNAVPVTYSAVHDNSQFGRDQHISSALETSNSLLQRVMEDDQMQMNSYMTFTLEDDLLETTLALDPEQYDAIQSMIKNPLYRAEDRLNVFSPSETPEPLINTYASFEL